MTLEQMRELMKDSINSYGEGFFGEDDMPEDVVVVEDGNWVQDYKYQFRTSIYKDADRNYFQVDNTRSGSPFTDWNYGTPEVCQVKPVERVITTTEWVLV